MAAQRTLCFARCVAGVHLVIKTPSQTPGLLELCCSTSRKHTVHSHVTCRVQASTLVRLVCREIDCFSSNTAMSGTWQLLGELAAQSWEQLVNLLVYNKVKVALSGTVIYMIYKIVRAEVRLKKLTSAIRDLPGPKAHWWYGHLKDFPGSNAAGVRYWGETTAKYPKWWKFYYGRYTPSINLCHPETIKVLLKTYEPKPGIIDNFSGYALMRPWIGDGLLTSRGDQWSRDRRLLTPAFHFDILKPYVTVFNRSADRLINWFELESKSGQSVEITQHVSLATFDSIMKCAMSFEETIDENHPYVRGMSRMADLLTDRFYKPLMWYDWLYYLTPRGREFRRLCQYVHSVSENVIQKRKEAKISEVGRGGSRHLDFLDILLKARDDQSRGLTDKEIRDQVDTFLFEGHDTTSSAISWCLYTLAGHVTEQERCREEILEALGDSDSDVMWETQSKLPFLTQCIKEAIRIHCPVPLIRRESTITLTIDGVHIPPGMQFDLITWCLHHNPTIWGEDHMEFKPDRFLLDNTKAMNSFSYLPFSAGPRNCIGQVFAMNELKVYIARVLTRFELSIDTEHPVEYVPEVVMRARHGIKLFFKAID